MNEFEKWRKQQDPEANLGPMVKAAWLACLDACVRMLRERADREHGTSFNASATMLDGLIAELQQELGAKP